MAKSLKHKPICWREIAVALSLSMVVFLLGCWFAQEFVPPINPYANRAWVYRDYEGPLGFARKVSIEAPNESAARETLRRENWKIRQEGSCVPALTGRSHVIAGEVSQ